MSFESDVILRNKSYHPPSCAAENITWNKSSEWVGLSLTSGDNDIMLYPLPYTGSRAPELLVFSSARFLDLGRRFRYSQNYTHQGPVPQWFQKWFDEGVSLKLSALIEGFATKIGYLREFQVS